MLREFVQRVLERACFARKIYILIWMHIYMQDISSARYRYCLTIFNLSRESYNVELLKVLFSY